MEVVHNFLPRISVKTHDKRIQAEKCLNPFWFIGLNPYLKQNLWDDFLINQFAAIHHNESVS